MTTNSTGVGTFRGKDVAQDSKGKSLRTRPIKICHVIMRARYSGAEILVRDLSLHQISQGYSVDIVGVEPGEDSFSPEIEKLKSNGVQVHSPTKRLGGATKRTLYTVRTLFSIKPDVVIAHGVLPTFYTRAASLLCPQYRHISVLHSNSDFHENILKMTEKLLKNLNDVVVAVSPEAQSEYRRIIGIEPETILIRNGVDLARFSFDYSVREQKRLPLLGASTDDLVFMQIGRICEQKQQLLTLRALDILSKRSYAPVKMFFAGTTEQSQYARDFFEAIKKPIPHTTIEFLGPRSDIPDLLTCADVCVMPSGWEAHSIAAIEAAASGILMILSDIPAFDGIRTSPGIYSFPSGSAEEFASVMRSLADQGGRARSDRMLDDYSIHRCAEKYSQLLYTLIN